MKEIRLAILASGAGSTSEVVFKKCVVIVTNNPDAGVIERAKRHNTPCLIRRRADFQVLDENGQVDTDASRLEYGEELIRIFVEFRVDFISQNGWSILTPSNIVEKFRDRIVNAHPASLDPPFPDFGGKGMHGLAVHAAVLNFARNIRRPFQTEVTLHKVVEEYDKGELLAYTPVEIKPDDSPETLQKRVQEVERRQNIEFWNKVENEGKLVSIQRPDRLIFPGEEKILEGAKSKAIEQYPRG